MGVTKRKFTERKSLTLRQALAVGGAFRKGERGVTVYADRFTPEAMRERARETGDAVGSIPFLKRFTLFSGPRGFDAGKKIKGRKRHALVDVDGGAPLIEPHAAHMQDRDGGGALLQASRRLFPFIRLVWADGAYNHERVTAATNVRVEIVSKIAGQSGFVVLPGRWVVERFFALIPSLSKEDQSQPPPRQRR